MAVDALLADTALDVSPASSIVTISGLTIANGVAPSYGGGINNDGVGGTALLKIANRTFSSNAGGGIYLNGEISGNATLEIGNTLLNGGAVGGSVLSSSGTVISRGYNLSSDGAGGDGSTGPGGLLNATGYRRNTDPLLDPAGLKNNG